MNAVAINPNLTSKMQELVTFARKNNKVMTLSEAFQKYPVEDEWHKGEIKNILKAYKITEEEINEIRKRGYSLSEYLQLRERK